MAMALYPFNIFSPNAAQTGFNPVLAGCLSVVGPFSLVNTVAITVRQASMTEDFSLRAWFSGVPCGVAVANAIFPVQTHLPAPFWLYVLGTTPPAPMYTAPAPAGVYYFTIQNLINQTVNFVYTQV
jgi:hypothetical protein